MTDVPLHRQAFPPVPLPEARRYVQGYQIDALKRRSRAGLFAALDTGIRAVQHPERLNPDYDAEAQDQPGSRLWSRLLILDQNNTYRAGDLVALRYIFFLVKQTLPGEPYVGYPKGMGSDGANLRLRHSSLVRMGVPALVKAAHHALHVMIYQHDNRPSGAEGWVCVRVEGAPAGVLDDLDAYRHIVSILCRRLEGFTIDRT